MVSGSPFLDIDIKLPTLSHINFAIHRRSLLHLPMSHEAEEEPHHSVDTPGMEAPVVEGEKYCLLSERVVWQGVICSEPVGTDGVVVDGLRHAEEENSSADTAGEQHTEPGGVIVLRLAVFGSYLDVTVLAEVNHQHEKNPEFLELMVVTVAKLSPGYTMAPM